MRIAISGAPARHLAIIARSEVKLTFPMIVSPIEDTTDVTVEVVYALRFCLPLKR
jgi:hypothetical protein